MATITLQHAKTVSGGQARPIFGKVTGALYQLNSIGQVTVDTLDAPSFLVKGYWPVPGSSDTVNNQAVINFGVFPGSPNASVTITGVPETTATLRAFVVPVATADHSVDEHELDPPLLAITSSADGTITINGYPSGRDLFVPAGTEFGQVATSQMPVGKTQCMPYGAWNVGWAS
jgi:hypothetical protein